MTFVITTFVFTKNFTHHLEQIFRVIFHAKFVKLCPSKICIYNIVPLLYHMITLVHHMITLLHYMITLLHHMIIILYHMISQFLKNLTLHRRNVATLLCQVIAPVVIISLAGFLQV